MKPKKIILILLVSVISVINNMAQQKDIVSIGLRGGANFSDVTNVPESQSVSGLVLGVTSTISFNQSYGLTIDGLYSVEGYKAPFEKYKLRYLHFPVYFDLFFGKLGSPFRPKVYAGISPSFFLSGTLNDLNVNEAYFNKFILHASGGLGFNYRVANRVWLNADGRVFVGLDDIRDNDETGESIQPRTFQTTIGLAYGLSKL